MMETSGYIEGFRFGVPTFRSIDDSISGVYEGEPSFCTPPL